MLIWQLKTNSPSIGLTKYDGTVYLVIPKNLASLWNDLSGTYF